MNVFFAFLRRKKVLLIVLSVILAVMLAVWIFYKTFYIPDTAYCEGVGEYSLTAESEAQREAFFAPFGYSGESLASYEIKVPCTGEVFDEYNEIQKNQGLDLLPYSGKTAVLYVLNLKNDKKEESYGFMIVYKNTVIGAHISDCLYPAKVRGLCEEN